MDFTGIKPTNTAAITDAECAEIYRRLYETMPEGASLVEMVYDADGKPFTFIYLDINPAWEEITGLSREDVIGKTLAEVFPEFCSEKMDVLGEIARTGLSRKIDCSYKDTLYEVYVFKFSENKLGFVFTDVTKKNRNSEKLAWLASFPEYNPQPVLEIDAQGNIIYQNRAAEKFSNPDPTNKLTNFLLADIAPYLADFEANSLQKKSRDVKIDGRWYRQMLLYLPSIQHLRIYAVDISDQIEAQNTQKKINVKLGELVSTRTTERNVATRIIQQNMADKAAYEEAAIHREQKQFETLIDLIPAYLVVLSPDYEIVRSNRYFREQFGETDGVKCFHCLFKRNTPCDLCESFKPLKTMNAHEWEWEGPNGRIYDVHDFPYMVDDTIMILEIGIDITNTKQAQRNISRMYRYNRGLIDINMDALMTVNKLGKISDVNETAITVTKRARNELIGSDFHDLFADRNEASRASRIAFEVGNVRDFELKLMDREGRTIPVTFNAIVFKTIEGEDIEFFASLRDQSEFKRKEEELLRLNRDLENLIAEDLVMHEQLVQAEKLAAMGRMLASITHEINNPLQTIKNSLYLIQADIDSDDPVVEYLEIASAETQRISNLVGQLREIYRPSNSNMEASFDLVSIVFEIESLLHGQSEAGKVKWVIHQPTTGNWYVKGDKDQIKQVFINVCNNSIEAMQPTGGQLELIFKQGIPGSNEAGVLVRDTGPGISVEYMDRLFEPFQTTKLKGAGLGLAISYEIVKKHKGRLMARNYENGAEFSVWLPLSSID